MTSLLMMIGVDVAKDWLQIADAERMELQVANRRAAIVAWLAQVPRGSCIAMEATGRYHLPLADLAHARGLLVYVLNPADLRHYARAVGMRSKTDRVDAGLIARYLVHERSHLHPYAPPTAQQREIDQLLRRRATLVQSKTQLCASLQDVAMCSRDLRMLVHKLDAMLAKFDQRLQQLAHGQAADQARVESVVGIGPLTSVALTNLFARVPLRDTDAAVAFVGFDPRAKDSGHHSGRRRLSKRGPAELRRLLFNGARSASKTKLWRPFYEALLMRGLSTTEATVILARKILRIAFSVYQHGTTFDRARIAHA